MSAVANDEIGVITNALAMDLERLEALCKISDLIEMTDGLPDAHIETVRLTLAHVTRGVIAEIEGRRLALCEL